MPNTRSQNGKTFEENIDTLFEELDLARKWGRPSILLTVHKSKFGQQKAQKILEDRLKKLGQSITYIVVSNERPDVPHLIVAAPRAANSVFFVSNIDWGGGTDGKDAYRALNMYRELLVENQIRVVFWLTLNESSNLARYAPDFWAFRHRVIEFASTRAPGRINLPAGVLIWDIPNSAETFDTSTTSAGKVQEGISAREELLAKLPHNVESLSTRVELLYNLGYLYWSLGNSKEASGALTAGLALLKDHQLPQTRSQLLNGAAIISYEAGKYDQAIEILREATKNISEDGSLLINWSAACCMLGRNQEAISISKRAIRADPANAKIRNSLGYIYGAMGRFDEAIECFMKAVEFAPKIPAYYEALAVSYSMIGRTDESSRRLEIARQLVQGQAAPFLDIYEQAVLGDPERALELLRSALSTHRISKHEVSRDPNIGMLFDASEIEILPD